MPCVWSRVIVAMLAGEMSLPCLPFTAVEEGLPEGHEVGGGAVQAAGG